LCHSLDVVKEEDRESVFEVVRECFKSDNVLCIDSRDVSRKEVEAGDPDWGDQDDDAKTHLH
jgi:hypothetical protein